MSVIPIAFVLVCLVLIIIGTLLNRPPNTCRKCGKKGTIKTAYRSQTGTRRKNRSAKGSPDYSASDYIEGNYEEYTYRKAYKECENCGEEYA